MSYAAVRNPKAPPISAGEFLRAAIGDLTVPRVAKAVGVSSKKLNAIMAGGRITPDMAIRLGRAFANGPTIWLRIQGNHDLWVAERQRPHKEIRPLAMYG
jgi:addiction module HigA family antidote